MGVKWESFGSDIEPLDEKVMREMMIEKLPEAISTLTDEEASQNILCKSKSIQSNKGL